MRKKLIPIISILVVVSFLALGCGNDNVKTDPSESRSNSSLNLAIKSRLLPEAAG